MYFVTAYFLSEGELNGVFGMCTRMCFLENALKNKGSQSILSQFYDIPLQIMRHFLPYILR